MEQEIAGTLGAFFYGRSEKKNWYTADGADVSAFCPVYQHNHAEPKNRGNKNIKLQHALWCTKISTYSLSVLYRLASISLTAVGN